MAPAPIGYVSIVLRKGHRARRSSVLFSLSGPKLILSYAGFGQRPLISRGHSLEHSCCLLISSDWRTSWRNVHYAEMSMTSHSPSSWVMNRISSTALSARFALWRPNARIAAAASSAMAPRSVENFIAVPIAPLPPGTRKCVTAPTSWTPRSRAYWWERTPADSIQHDTVDQLGQYWGTKPHDRHAPVLRLDP